MNSQTTELPDETERAAFEAEFIRPDAVTWDGSKYQVREGWEGSYRIEGFLAGWRAWQARAALEHAQRVAQPDEHNKLKAFFHEVAELTKEHDELAGHAVVFPRKLGEALERVDTNWHGWGNAATPSAGEAEARDAARYRWLRSDDIEVPSGQREILVYRMALPFREDQTDELLLGHDLDAAIDAAMASGSAG